MVGGRPDRSRSLSGSSGLRRRAVLRRKDSEIFSDADAKPEPSAAQAHERHANAKAFAESERFTEGENQDEAQVFAITNRDPSAVP